MKKLKPILLDKKQLINTSEEILNYLIQVLYTPLKDILKEDIDIKYNSISSILENALNNNTIYIIDNRIYGKFNSKITKELIKLGGVYNSRGKYFRFNSGLPTDLINIQFNKQIKNENLVYKIDNFLNDFLSNIDDSIKFLDLSYKDTLEDYNKQFNNNFNVLGINYQLKDKDFNNFNYDYINDSKIKIKGFTENNINNLRNKLKDFVLNKGTNTRDIAKYILNTYNTSKNQAVLIARQESNLILANYTKTRYKETGIKKFEWQTSNDEKVRNYPTNNGNGQNHKYLDGKIFDLDNPPITNLITGHRALPGEDINCRCVMVPIIE